MSDLEGRLRRGMTDRAEAIAPLADLDNLVERIAGDRARRRRISAVTLAVVVIVGPIAGFAVARASDASPVHTVRRAERSKVVPTTTKFPASPLPALRAVPPHSTVNSPALTADRLAASTDAQAKLEGPIQQLNLGRMFARTSSDGIELRVYGARLPDETQGAPWWNPPPTCFPDRVVQVDASNALVAGSAQGYLYPAPRDGLVAAVSVVGASEGSPLWVAVVQAAKGTTARATFPDGGTDSSTLTGAVAVLSHAVGKGADLTTLAQQPLHVEMLDATGAVVADTSVRAQDNPRSAAPTLPAECVTPTTLPAPGAQQPADIAAATAGVTQAVTDVYTGTSSVAVREAAIDDPHGVGAVYDELEHGGFAQQVNTAVPHVRGVVFLSATEAAVAYDISIPNYSDFNGQLGEAVLTGGRWKLTRRTFCTAVTLAIVTCPP